MATKRQEQATYLWLRKACPPGVCVLPVYIHIEKGDRNGGQQSLKGFSRVVSQVLFRDPLHKSFPNYVGKRYSEIPFDNLLARPGRALVIYPSKEFRQSVAER